MVFAFILLEKRRFSFHKDKEGFLTLFFES